MGRALPALAVLFSVSLTCEPVFAQSGGDIVNIFGGLVQSAINQAIQAEWRKLPPAEISCIDDNLRQRGTSVGQVIQQGFSPSDGRLAELRRVCRTGLVQNPTNLASSPSVISIYAVDGLSLGAKVSFESSVYRQYQCSPSEQFNGFTWCARKVPESSKRGPFVSSYSILHSPDGTVSYVNRFLEPAWFSGNEANEDIARLAKKYGAQPNVMAMPQIDGLQGLMASWGAVRLVSLDASNVAQLAQGRDIRAGLMVDFLGNFRRSAQLGLPIYRLAGGRDSSGLPTGIRAGEALCDSSRWMRPRCRDPTPSSRRLRRISARLRSPSRPHLRRQLLLRRRPRRSRRRRHRRRSHRRRWSLVSIPTSVRGSGSRIR
ncbi:hypothetical protein [Bradyrhizobium japonicum]|uniref:hypothetical protein n=1 Tax=Bradyrhizobium japonicum TaxID=375 RepID=UPI000231BD5E|nr:hypothetical protein [Bradyrhizobium japonicum]BAL06792.1 hypothetical protein BJ6T_15050 [Bradyrhizobium japonicum USDA 6]